MEQEIQFDDSEIRGKLAEAAEDIMKGDVELRRSMAAEIVKHLSNRIEQTDLVDILLTKETLALNEVPKYEFDGEVDAYIHAPGSYAPMTQPRNREMTIPQEMISAHIMLPLLQLKAGRYGTISDQIDSARRAIQAQKNKMALDTVIAAVPSTTTLGNYVAESTAGTLTQTTLDAAINYIEDQTGGGRVITGRRNKLNSILTFNTGQYTMDIFPDSVKEDIIRRGVLGQYKGLPIAGWKQYKTRDGRMTLAETSALVLGQQVGSFVQWGEDMGMEEDLEVGTLNWHIHAYTLCGAGVWFPENIYRIYIG